MPPAIYHSVATVAGLQRGRTDAKETEPVGPIDDAIVDATLPFLNRHVRGLVEFQRLTGCRPGEACSVRRCDIDTGGAVWLYKPVHHKNTWRGKPRTIAIGPKAQSLLREFLTANRDEYVFSPRRAVEELLVKRSASRVTPRWPSHQARNERKRKSTPNRMPKERYDRTSYTRAIARGCEQAFAEPGELDQREDETREAWRARLSEWRAQHGWSPNQLRHSYATRTRKMFSLEHAGAVLGHSKMSATEVYAERDAGLALEVAAKIG